MFFKMKNLLNAILQVSTKINSYAKIHIGVPTPFKFSEINHAEPLKKKKRLDPAILKTREDRKKKRLEKAIKTLEKRGRILKPLIECEPEPQFLRELEARKRPVVNLSQDELNEQAIAYKEWARYKVAQNKDFARATLKLIKSQKRALEELKKVSLPLYQEAIKLDESLIPLSKDGPVCTPPIQNYDSPDGEFVDVTKTYIR